MKKISTVLTLSGTAVALAIVALAVTAVFGWILIRYLDAPVVYDSHSETLATGKTVCAFVDTKNGKKPCTAFSEDERAKMRHEWAE